MLNKLFYCLELAIDIIVNLKPFPYMDVDDLLFFPADIKLIDKTVEELKNNKESLKIIQLTQGKVEITI